MSTHPPIHGDATLNAIGETAAEMDRILSVLIKAAQVDAPIDTSVLFSLQVKAHLIKRLAKAAAQ